LEDTVEAAEFFLSDGVIITGTHTGKAVDLSELSRVYRGSKGPVLVGSGVTPTGLQAILENADAFIVGSYFKRDGKWQHEPDPARLSALMGARAALI
jgi:hypothetical protein